MKKFLNCCIAAALLSGAHSAAAGVFTEAGFQQLYLLNIPNNADYNTGAAPAYSVDNSASIATGSFDRVAYYLELQIGTAPLNWIWVSFDTPSPNASHLGVPGNLGSAQTFDSLVSNMNVFSNAAVTTGTGIATGAGEGALTEAAARIEPPAPVG